MTVSILDISKRMLKKVWGYDSFRDGQMTAISATFNKKDSLNILSTGVGKSVCYQIPALVLKGTCVVISPLVSLMRDQVQELVSVGVKATFINSDLSLDEINDRLEKLSKGEYKLIYLAPERFNNENVLSALAKIPLSFFAIDEAHCTSSWGHNFRPLFKKINDNIQTLEKVHKKRFCRSAYTATATDIVQKDIIEILGMNDPVLNIGNVARNNILLSVIHCEEDKYLKMLNLVEKHKEDPIIIYCQTQKKVESVYQYLSEKGILSSFYHGGLDSEQKNENQDKFISGQVNIIVATNAFGMGINKSNVRLVIHESFPATLENYYQEVGRAGRDGKISKAVLLYSPKDRYINQMLLSSSYPDTSKFKIVSRILLDIIGDEINYFTFQELKQKSLDLVSDLDDAQAVTGLSIYDIKTYINLLEENGVLLTYREEGDYDGLGVSVEDMALFNSLTLDYLDERRVSESFKLNAMERYCNTTTPPYVFIANYFNSNEKISERLLTSPDAKVTLNKGVNKMIVDSINYLFDNKIKTSIDHIIDILLGKNESYYVRSKKLNKLPFFGKLSHITETDLKLMLNEMIKNKEIKKDSLSDIFYCHVQQPEVIL